MTGPLSMLRLRGERRDAAPARAKAARQVRPARSRQGPPDAGSSGSVAPYPVRPGESS